MSKYKTLGFIGGDRRQLYVISGLAEDGYNISVFGIDEGLGATDKIRLCSDVCDVVSSSDAIVLPVPYCSVLCGDNINTPLSRGEIRFAELSSAIDTYGTGLILAGRADERLRALECCGALKVIDYMEREELAVLNAIPTAEGAIKLAMNELPVTIHGSECLVTGFGRVSKILCRALYGLGAKVTVSVRKKGDLAYIKAFGYEGADITKPLEAPKRYDIIFNTVPHLIIDRGMLGALRSDTLVIDLASKPGGVDFEAAKELGRNVIWALSLPGKTAPMTAGNIIRDTINNILSEQER